MTKAYLYDHVSHVLTLRRLKSALAIVTEEQARADFAARIGQLVGMAAQEERTIKAFAEEIGDDFTRSVFYARYVDCLTWTVIADRAGGGNTADGMRKTVERGIDGLLDG